RPPEEKSGERPERLADEDVDAARAREQRRELSIRERPAQRHRTTQHPAQEEQRHIVHALRDRRGRAEDAAADRTAGAHGDGAHWPLCNWRLLPPLGDLGTLIEWNHRLAAALVSILVVALAGSAWWLRRDARSATPDVSNGPIGHRLRPLATARDRPGVGAYVALALLLVQVGLGAVTVKLALPPWTVILHLGTAMLLVDALIVAAQGSRLTPGLRPGLVALALGFATVLFGALTANL